MHVIEKPWGSEEVIEVNERYMVKRLTMRKGHRCSLQLHEMKMETVYVLGGRLRVLSGASRESLADRVMTAGEWITIAPRVVHRMEGLEDSVYLEASTPEMQDVVRLSDDYKRV